MRTERELNIFQRNNRSREGENPASRISFNHAGENHVHAVTKVRILPPASIDDDVVEAICGGRPVHTEA